MQIYEKSAYNASTTRNEIVRRFFLAIEILKLSKQIRGEKTLCDRYGINRRNLYQLRHIITAELPDWKCKYRDIFVLQFYLIGINIVDLLTTAQLVGDRVEYRRAKTHRLYSIKVEPEALAIIDRYRGETHLLNVADNYKDYRAFAEKVNNALGTIVDGCTTYFARHTWATIAASLDIPKETIAHALGHGAKSVTDIYIDFDRSKVDEANRKVIDFVKGKGGTSATP